MPTGSSTSPEGVLERHSRNEDLVDGPGTHFTEPWNLHCAALRGALGAMPERHIQATFARRRPACGGRALRRRRRAGERPGRPRRGVLAERSQQAVHLPASAASTRTSAWTPRAGPLSGGTIAIHQRRSRRDCRGAGGDLRATSPCAPGCGWPPGAPGGGGPAHHHRHTPGLTRAADRTGPFPDDRGGAGAVAGPRDSPRRDHDHGDAELSTAGRHVPHRGPTRCGPIRRR